MRVATDSVPPSAPDLADHGLTPSLGRQAACAEDGPPIVARLSWLDSGKATGDHLATLASGHIVSIIGQPATAVLA